MEKGRGVHGRLRPRRLRYPDRGETARVTEPVTDQLDDLAPLLDRVPGWAGRAHVVEPRARRWDHEPQLPRRRRRRAIRRADRGRRHAPARDRPPRRAHGERTGGRARLRGRRRRVRRAGVLPRDPVRRGRRHHLTQCATHRWRTSARCCGLPRLGAAPGRLRLLPGSARTPERRRKPRCAHPRDLRRAVERSPHRARSREPEPAVPCHNDLLAANFLPTGAGGPHSSTGSTRA